MRKNWKKKKKKMKTKNKEKKKKDIGRGKKKKEENTWHKKDKKRNGINEHKSAKKTKPSLLQKGKQNRWCVLLLSRHIHVNGCFGQLRYTFMTVFLIMAFFTNTACRTSAPRSTAFTASFGKALFTISISRRPTLLTQGGRVNFEDHRTQNTHDKKRRGFRARYF